MMKILGLPLLTSPPPCKFVHEKLVLGEGLLPPPVVQRDQHANGCGQRGVYQAVVDAAADVVALENAEAVLDQADSSRLAASYEHFHPRFQASELLQHFALKIVVGDAHHERMLRRFVNSCRGFAIILGSHKKQLLAASSWLLAGHNSPISILINGSAAFPS